MSKFKVNFCGEEVELDATRQGDVLHVVHNGTTRVLHLVANEGSTLLLEEVYPNGQRQRLRIYAHATGDKRQVWVNGRQFTYERVRERGGRVAGNEGALAAAIPAVVSQILVQVGDTVSEGDKLILLESMKMVIPIQAPYTGTVTAVHCTVGESVPADVPLIEVVEI